MFGEVVFPSSRAFWDEDNFESFDAENESAKWEIVLTSKFAWWMNFKFCSKKCIMFKLQYCKQWILFFIFREFKIEWTDSVPTSIEQFIVIESELLIGM